MRRLLFLPIPFLAGALCAQTPAVPANGLVNGASFQVGAPVAAGSLVSIFGTDLSSSIASADTVPLSTNLGNATVTFQTPSASFTAPLLYTQGSQINAQVPWELAPGAGTLDTVNVVVVNNGISSPPTPVTISSGAPGIFVVGTLAVVTNLDGTLTWATGAVAGIDSHPAKAGDIVVVYATGLGAVDSPIADGANSLDKLRHTLVTPTVLIGGVSSQVQFSGLNPGFVGLNQINVVIPSVPPGNTIPIQIQMGTFTSPANATIAVSQ
jgi:uncharacterized protein (TIGR03437 family)